MQPEDQGGTGFRFARRPWRERAFWIGMTLIVLMGGFLRFQSLDSGLPHLRTRPDEYPIVEQTELPARGRFRLEGWAMYPPAYVYLCWIWAEGVLRAGRITGSFPDEGYLTVFSTNRPKIFLIDRALSALAGTLAVALLMVLARRTLGKGAACVAGLLLATCFLHVRDSHTLKPDAVLSFWVVMTFLALPSLSKHATARNSVLAGAAAGAAMSAKYSGVLLLVPVYAAALMGSDSRGWRRPVPGAALWAGAAAAVVFLCTSPFLLFDTRAKDFLFLLLRVLFPFLGLHTPEDSGAARGIFAALPASPGLRSFLYHARFSLWYGAGPLVTLSAPLAVAWGLACRRPVPILGAIFAITWYAVASLVPHYYARYLTPLLPVLAFLEGGFFAALASRLRGRAGPVALAITAVLLCARPLADTVSFNRVAGRTDTRVLATRWMVREIPRGARVAVLGTVFWNWGVPDLPPGVWPVNLKRRPGVADLEESAVDYVVTHEHELFSSTLDPESLAAILPRLRLLAEFDPREPGRTDAVFEPTDAYYVPFHNFDAITRPGPRIRIYAFD